VILGIYGGSAAGCAHRVYGSNTASKHVRTLPALATGPPAISYSSGSSARKEKFSWAGQHLRLIPNSWSIILPLRSFWESRKIGLDLFSHELGCALRPANAHLLARLGLLSRRAPAMRSSDRFLAKVWLTGCSALLLSACGLIRDQTDPTTVSIRGVPPTVEQLNVSATTGAQNSWLTISF
jgi:hypothetical protein